MFTTITRGMSQIMIEIKDRKGRKRVKGMEGRKRWPEEMTIHMVEGVRGCLVPRMLLADGDRHKYA